MEIIRKKKKKYNNGRKVWISAVIQYLRSGKEFNFEISARQFDKFTKKKKCAKKAKPLTGEFENRRKVDAENREVVYIQLVYHHRIVVFPNGPEPKHVRHVNWESVTRKKSIAHLES